MTRTRAAKKPPGQGQPLTEGCDKGGRNTRPTTPRPDPPMAQTKPPANRLSKPTNPLAAAMLRLAEKLEDEDVPNERTDTMQRAEYLERWDAARRIRETVRRYGE